MLFFTTSNLAEWARDPIYPKTPAGLALCFVAAIPFFWATLTADLLGTAFLFSVDALARRRRLAIAARASPPGSSSSYRDLSEPRTFRPPASESVVVHRQLGSRGGEGDRFGRHRDHAPADREERDAGRLDLLRSVPGLDVVTLGSPGSQTSLFTRGTNSTQTLVLVDGARMNSPFFAGYDWSALTTENVDRIEIVRGPFSALYGSDAIGGVVQVFTRSPLPGVSGTSHG